MTDPKKKVIPATELYHRYRFFKYTSKGERQAQAEFFAASPPELANAISRSVAHFARYDNVKEPFFDGVHSMPKPRPAPINATVDLAVRLAAAGTIVPREPDGGRLHDQPLGAVISVPAEELAFDYVERELTVTRTQNGIWEHGLPGANKLTLDLLLAEHVSRTPIVAELKIRDDKDLYYALIQALACLACLACLATPNQYARLRKHLNQRGAFPALGDDPPRLDLYVLLVGSGIRGDVQEGIEAAVCALGAHLLRFNHVAASVRRIVALKLPEDDSLDATVHFAYGRP